jgi:hypothetical protein
MPTAKKLFGKHVKKTLDYSGTPRKQLKETKLSDRTCDSANNYEELHNGGKSDRQLFGDRRPKNRQSLDESEYETADECSDDELVKQCRHIVKVLRSSKSEKWIDCNRQ